MKKFWNWNTDDDTGRILTIDGTIAEESWFDDEITPKLFKNELASGKGNVTLWLNSPGGDCVAASQIYAMLMDYTGQVHVNIDGIAASAASVIAMAGTTVNMAPTALMMEPSRDVRISRSPIIYAASSARNTYDKPKSGDGDRTDLSCGIISPT